MAPLALVPLRGIRFRDEDLEVNPFEQQWTLLSLRQMEVLASRYPPDSSFQGNLAMIRERLAPDAFLLVECSQPSAPGYLRAYERAETLLGAICLAKLLALEDPVGPRQYIPRPVYWTRAREFSDLPLVIDQDCVRLVGHSSNFAWLSPGEIQSEEPMLLKQLYHLLAAGPSTIRDILEDSKITEDWRIRLEAGARAIHAGFQATSPGQLIANMISAAEVIIALEDREPWWRRVARLKVLAGPTYWTRVQDIISARHDYVHEAKQPQFGYLAFGALGLCVHTWAVVHEMCEQAEDLESMLRILDQLADADPPRHRTTNDLSTAELRSIHALYSTLPRGPLRRLHWINQALTDLHPNDYYEQFSIFGESCCSNCGTALRQGDVVARTSEAETFVCPQCGKSVEAMLPFASSR